MTEPSTVAFLPIRIVEQERGWGAFLIMVLHTDSLKGPAGRGSKALHGRWHYRAYSWRRQPGWHSRHSRLQAIARFLNALRSARVESRRLTTSTMISTPPQITSR